MADIAITTYTNKIYKQGASTVVPGFIEGDPGSPVNPPGSGGASEFVPYVGAINDVDLGEKGLSTGYITFDTTPTDTPTTQGTMSWDDSKETVALIMNGTTQRIGQDLYIYVKNSTGVDIDKGVNVGFAGTDGASGHILIKKFLADGSEPSYYYIGVTSEAIDNGDFGQVMIIGELSGIDTSVYSPNPLLYASTTVAGAFQTTAPVAPNNIILVAAAVNFKNNGEIRIRPTFVSIGGSGTANYIPKFTGALSIGNSQIIDNGTNILVNKTVDSGQKFQVNGTVLLSNTLTEIAGLNPTLRLKTTGNTSYIDFRKDNNEDAVTLKFDDAVDEFAITTNVSNYPIRIEPHGTGNILLKKNVQIDAQIYSPSNSKGNSGSGTVTFNWNDSNIQTVTLTGNCTFAFSNPQSGGSYQIVITQDGTGGRTITWPTVYWQNKTTPLLSNSANTIDVITLLYDGSKYLGLIAKNFGTP